MYCRNPTYYENFKVKLLGIRTKFQVEIFTINMISGISYFHEIISESSRNVSETIPRNAEKDSVGHNHGGNKNPFQSQTVNVVLQWNRFPHYCPFVREIQWSSVDSPLKGKITRSFDVSFFTLAWTNYQKTVEWPMTEDAVLLMWCYSNVISS